MNNVLAQRKVSIHDNEIDEQGNFWLPYNLASISFKFGDLSVKCCKHNYRRAYYINLN